MGEVDLLLNHLNTNLKINNKGRKEQDKDKTKRYFFCIERVHFNEI